MFVGQDTKFSPQGIHRLQLCHLQFPKQFVSLHKDNLCTLSLSTGYLMLTFSRSFLVCVCIFFFPVLNPSETFSGYSLDRTLNKAFYCSEWVQHTCRIFMSSVEVFRVCLVRGLRVKCSEVNVPTHVTDYNTPPCFEKDSAMGQKGALWAWTKISKDMLKIYGKRDK